MEKEKNMRFIKRIFIQALLINYVLLHHQYILLYYSRDFSRNIDR